MTFFEEDAIAIVKGTDIKRRTIDALNLLGGIDGIVCKGDKVLIKPNIVDGAPFETGEVVQLQTITALTEEVLRAGASEVIIGETPGIAVREITKTWRAYERAAKRLGVEFLCFLDSTFEEILVEDPVFFQGLKVPKDFVDCDVLINVPTLKTHCQCGITCAIKNYYGFLRDTDKRMCHKTNRVEEVIVDLYQSRKADLIVVDGTYTTFHMGPRPIKDFKETTRLNLTLAGIDPIAVDLVSARILGIEPRTLRYLKWGEEKGLGTRDVKKIKILGMSLEKAHFGEAVDVVKFFNARRRNAKILNYGACTGCLSAIMTIYKEIGDTNTKNKFLFVMGPHATESRVRRHMKGKEKIILCGHCAAPNYFNDLRGEFVGGCPPSPDEIGITIRSSI